MKKILSYITAASLLMAQPCTVYSAETAVSESDEVFTESIFVFAYDTVSVTNGKFTFTYDAEQFKATEVILCESLEKTLNVINTNEPGKIVIAFASAAPVTVDDYFAEVKFERISGDGHAVMYTDFSTDELVTVDENGADINLPEETANIGWSSYGDLFMLSDGKPNSDGTATVSVKSSSDFTFTNGILTVTFNPEELKFESGALGEELKGVMAEINEEKPGTVKIAFISSSKINYSGEFVKLTFRSLKSGTAEVTLNADEVLDVDSRGKEFPVFCNESVSSVTAVTPPQEEVSCDVDDDGSVSTADIITLARIIAGLDEAVPGADVNGDGVVNVNDLAELVKVFKNN